jgi:hypothetical protein
MPIARQLKERIFEVRVAGRTLDLVDESARCPLRTEHPVVEDPDAIGVTVEFDGEPTPFSFDEALSLLDSTREPTE